MESNIFRGLDQTTAGIVSKATAYGLTPTSLFLVMLKTDNKVCSYFKEQMDIKKLILDLETEVKKEDENPGFSKRIKKVLKSAYTTSQSRYLDEVNFAFILLNQNDLMINVRKVLSKYLDFNHVRDDIKGLINPKPKMVWIKNDNTILDTLGRNLTELAAEGELDIITGREEEMQRVIQVLTRQTKSNPIIIGEAGIGKTALVEKIASTLLDHTSIPGSLHDHQLYEISIAAIIATDKIEKTVAAIIDAAKVKTILFMDEMHLIMNDNGKIANLLKPAMARGDIKLIGATTLDEFKVFEHDKAMTRRLQPVKLEEPNQGQTYEILKEKARQAEGIHSVLIPNESLLKAIQLSERYIQHRKQPDKAIDLIEEASAKLRMILESKPEALIKKERKFNELQIEVEIFIEQNDMETISQRNIDKLDSLKEKAAEIKAEMNRLQEEYSKQRVLLEEMIRTKKLLSDSNDMLKDALHTSDFEAATNLRINIIPMLESQLIKNEDALLEFAKTTDENLIQNVVTPNMIARIIEDQTGIPVSAQSEDDFEKYKDMEAVLREKVHGQNKAIRLISAAIQRSKVGFSDSNKPIGSFLALGPTGVGKTFLAQKLAEFIFDTDKVLHRFDMSEYMESHSVARLFGSPPGYVGHDEGGQLTETIKNNPYSIILFDEIEKAHPRVFDALLQILDAGRMTDGKGNIINFKNTIIIMTSNIGAGIIKDGLQQGYSKATIEEALFTEVRKHFKPEFLNRFDAQIMFNSLSPQAVHKIAESELQVLQERIHLENDIDINWHPDLATLITNQAYDVANGARPIKRFINDIIVGKLTNMVLGQEIAAGDLVYIQPDVNDIQIFSVTPEDLKELMNELPGSKENLDDDLVAKRLDQDPYKVNSSDLVDADINEKKSKKKKSKKSKKKSLREQIQNSESFTLDTEVGD